MKLKKNNMKEFIEYILQQIVSRPDDIKVNEVTQDGFTTYEIDVHEDDMGLTIGKNGRTIRSIRSLIKAKAIRDGVRVRVDLIDKNGPQEGTPDEPQVEEAEVETEIEKAQPETVAEETVVEEAQPKTKDAPQSKPQDPSDD